MSSFYNLGSWGPKQASLCFRVLSEEVTQCRLKLRSANSLPESFLWTMTFSWLFCFFPPLEYGTNWSECQWPACQPVFRLCIFPELAILSRKKKKKSFVLNKQGTKRYFALSVTSKDTTHEWGRGHYMSTSIPTRGCGYSLMESHKHGCLLTYSLSLNPRSQPTRISCRSPTLPLWAVSLVKLSKSL